MDDSPASGGIENFDEFRFDALFKIGACPLCCTDWTKLQRLSF